MTNCRPIQHVGEIAGRSVLGVKGQSAVQRRLHNTFASRLQAIIRIAAPGSSSLRARRMAPRLISSGQGVPSALPTECRHIHQLPVGILMEVFLGCLSLKKRPRDRTPPAYRNQAPPSLRQVCSSWRRIVLRTPALWSSLVMDISL